MPESALATDLAFVSPSEPGQSVAFEPSPEQEEIINEGVIETVTKIEGVVALGGAVESPRCCDVCVMC